MPDESRSLFFMRTFGFALFWIWLFLVAVSPSPLFGALKGLGSLPFEVWEVGARLLLLSLSLAATRLLTTSRGRWVYPVCCLVGGPVAALALSSAATPEAVTLAAFITAVVDVAMLIMWLCYFGYAKIGDIAFMLACSYALGSILYLAVVAAGETAMLVAAITSPILSGALFAYFVKNPPSLASEGLFQASPAAGRRPKLPAALRRLAIGLTLYAFVFALFSSRTAVSEYTFSSGPLVQALASIVLAAVVIAAIRLSDVSGGLYALYRSVPLVFGGGAALFLVLPAGLSLCAGFFVMFGYLLFEALSFNDFCNATKTNDGSLLRSMLIVRIAGSLGIFLGWVLGAPLSAALDPDQSSRLIIALCFVVVIVAASLVFTDKAMGTLGTIAGMRARQEAAEARLDKTRLIPLFATEHDLSKREAEVLEYLLQGRTMQYTAEKLFIAESTARSHVHKIYQKTETRGRMELIDRFEQFCSEHPKP